MERRDDAAGPPAAVPSGALAQPPDASAGAPISDIVFVDATDGPVGAPEPGGCADASMADAETATYHLIEDFPSPAPVARGKGVFATNTVMKKRGGLHSPAFNVASKDAGVARICVAREAVLEASGADNDVEMALEASDADNGPMDLEMALAAADADEECLDHEMALEGSNAECMEMVLEPSYGDDVVMAQEKPASRELDPLLNEIFRIAAM